MSDRISRPFADIIQIEKMRDQSRKLVDLQRRLRDIESRLPKFLNTLQVTTRSSSLLSSSTPDPINLTADDIDMNLLSTPTYQTIQDWSNITQSAGKTSGGTITDNANGTVAVAAGTGIIKTTDSDIGENKFFAWSTDSSVSLTDDSINWIYVDYNSGSPIVESNVSIAAIDFHTQIIIGRVFRHGTHAHTWEVGQDLSDYMRKACYRQFEIDGATRAGGLVTAESGERYLTMTEGVLWCAHNRETVSSIDTTGADTFSLWYSDGGAGFTEVTTQSQVNNTNYDDGDGTLGSLTVNKYGTFWVYVTFDGELHIQYGTLNGTLAQAIADAAPIPPSFLGNFALFIAKIIIQQGASNFTSIETPFDTTIPGSTVTDHGSLGGLSDDDHPQYLLISDIDDAPVDAETDAPISSNWAFDHDADASAHHIATVSGDIDHDATTNFVAAEHKLEADIDHDALTNFVAAEHKLEADIDHDALTNFVADEHIDWKSTAENFATTGTLGTGTATITTSIQVAAGAIITTLGDVAALADSDVKIPTNTTVKEYIDQYNFPEDVDSGTIFYKWINLDPRLFSNTVIVGSTPWYAHGYFSANNQAMYSSNQYMYSASTIEIPVGWKIKIVAWRGGAYSSYTDASNHVYWQELLIRAVSWDHDASPNTRSSTDIKTLANPFGVPTGNAYIGGYNNSSFTEKWMYGYDDDNTAVCHTISCRYKVKETGNPADLLYMEGHSIKVHFEKI